MILDMICGKAACFNENERVFHRNYYLSTLSVHNEVGLEVLGRHVVSI